MSEQIFPIWPTLLSQPDNDHNLKNKQLRLYLGTSTPITTTTTTQSHKLLVYMSRPRNSFKPHMDPTNILIGPIKIENEPKFRSIWKVTTEKNIENLLLVHMSRAKIIFDPPPPYPKNWSITSKISPKLPQN